ncbi:MAG: DNA-binding protein [Longimonas sp.]|uniref:PPC domain-containing DNA-binding protein n=1 Tax=Longimonas sp. TaxID=2039626 RepID=UPI003354A9AA
MNHRVLDLTPAAAHLLVFDQQADFMEELAAFGERRSVQSATFQGIGAFSSATLAFFDREAQRYDPIEVATQTEVLHVSGNLTHHEGEIRVHAHATLSYPDGSTIGGHLLQATVWPTLELQCQTYSTRIGRTDHEDIGLPLIPQSSPAQ